MTIPADLAAREAQLRMLLDHVPARVALLDRDRRHCYVNQEYVQFVGRPVEAIIGHTVAEITGAEPFTAFRGLSERALAGEAVQWEGWMPRHDTGERRFVQRFYVPYRGSHGTIDGYFTLTRDLTELKHSEERVAEQFAAVHASEALAAAITTAALDCVVVIDESDTVVLFNPAAEATFGYSSEEAVGRSLADLILPPPLRSAHLSAFRRFLVEGKPRLLGRRIEMEAMRKDGSTFPSELAVTEVKLPSQRLFATYLRDLTTTKQAEAQIRRQRETLHQMEKIAAFGSLLAGVAHELNNPLSIVIGHAVLLEEEAREHTINDIASRAEKIRLAAERCGQTIRTFLAMARQRGQRRGRIDADALLHSAFALLKDSFDAADIEVRWNIPSSLPSISGDADQLHHVISNLAINAQQALIDRPGRRWISVASTTENNVLQIAISDNGLGVPAAIRSRIFDPFFTTKKPGSGTGIGLAVARGIAESHGGTLVLDAEYLDGARFVLQLPLGDAAPASQKTSDQVALGDYFWSPSQPAEN